MRSTVELDNPFSTPVFDILVKSAEEGGQRIVYLEASNEVEDQDGETVSMGALQSAREFFLAKGVLSWDHQHKILHNPEFIIGEPLDTKFTDDKRTLIKGFLYEYNEIANGVWNNIRSRARRLGASIGGGILKKSREDKWIEQVVWDEVALTHKPVNDRTMGNVTMVPFASFAKALMAGAGVDAGAFVGGRALQGESLQGASNGPEHEELTDLFSVLIKAIVDGRIQSYDQMKEFVTGQGYDGGVAARLIRFITRKMPSLADAFR